MIVRIGINIFCFLNSTTKPVCNNMRVLNLKLRDILTNKEKDVNEEAQLHNSIYIFYSFRGQEKDLFHLNNMINHVSHNYNFCYSRRFQNYSETLPYCVLIIYFTVLIFLYISCYSHVWNKLNYSAVIIYFIMFPFYYMQCFTGIPERRFILHLRNITLPHYTFYCKHLSLVSRRMFIS